MHLNDNKFDKNLKQLKPITLNKKGKLDLNKSEIATDLEMLSMFSENFSSLFSVEDYERQKD